MPRSAVRSDTILRLAERTLSCRTAPYREGDVIAWVRAFAAARPHLRLREDPDGNLELGRAGVRRRARPLVLAAHMDHPGFRARRSVRRSAARSAGSPAGRSARRGGRWRVEADFLGGVPLASFPGARARFFAGDDEIPARVERARPDPRSGGKRVVLSARRAVPPGAFGMWDLPRFRRAPGDPGLLEACAVDDLAGVAAILALLDAVERIDPRRRADVRGVFTRAEEVGFVGALAIAAGRRLPRGARIVAIEASKALPDAPQGHGPIVRVGDRTSIFDDALTRWIAGVGAGLAAGRGGFAWQRKLMDGGTCESTAYQLFGFRCAAMCLPLGNYHNVGPGGRIAAESIRADDLVGLVRFFEGLVRADARPRARGAPPDPRRARLEQRLARGRRDLRRDPFA